MLVYRWGFETYMIKKLINSYFGFMGTSVGWCLKLFLFENRSAVKVLKCSTHREKPVFRSCAFEHVVSTSIRLCCLNCTVATFRCGPCQKAMPAQAWESWPIRAGHCPIGLGLLILLDAQNKLPTVIGLNGPDCLVLPQHFVLKVKERSMSRAWELQR